MVYELITRIFMRAVPCMRVMKRMRPNKLFYGCRKFVE
jgi:hypothetical protein